MSTVDKALSVLDLFSEGAPNLGLSEIARKLGWDKSNVQRYVSDLAGRGILEQDPRDKSYYLGPALTRLAMVRERTHPLAGEVKRVLEELVETTGETAHASAFVNGRLMTTLVVETKIRGTRVYVDPAAALPLHATGSGIAFLSRCGPERVEALLGQALEVFTPETPRHPSDVLDRIKTARQNDYATLQGSFESDVVGIASPVVGFHGEATGAVAVATPKARFGDGAEAKIAARVIAAAARLSRMHGAA